MRPDDWHRRRALVGAVALAVAAIVVVAVLLATGGGSTGGGSRIGGGGRTRRPVPGPAAHTATGAVLIGANVDRLFNDRTLDAGAIDTQLGALRATGATVARTDTLWEAVEQEPPTGGVHHYDWSFDDRIATALASHHLEWLPIIDYTAQWAKADPGELHSPPRTSANYAAFAAAFAARYGQGGSFWRAHSDLPGLPVDTFEIWNEPDGPTFWSPAPDASRYADLYLSARDAITAVDPSAKVIVGGLTKWATFLPAMLAARPELRGHVDGVAIHPYSATPVGILANVRTARLVMRSQGLGTVPLYVTEFGWTTRPVGAQHYASQRLRPGYIAGTITGLLRSNCEIAAVVVYTWVTPERDPRAFPDWFGIHSPGGASTPDSDAFTAALRSGGGSSARSSLCS